MNPLWHFRAAMCLHDITQQISNLLCYATHTEPEPLDNDWLEKTKRDISSVTVSAGVTP